MNAPGLPLARPPTRAARRAACLAAPLAHPAPRSALGRAGGLALLALCLAGSGCSLLPPAPGPGGPGSPPATNAAPGAAAAQAAAAPADLASGPAAVDAASGAAPANAASAAAGAPLPRLGMVLDVQAPAPLKDLLLRHLDLSRVQQLPDQDTLSPQEGARLIAAAPQQVRDLLQTEGYFDPEVSVYRAGQAGAVAAPGGPQATPTAEAAPGTGPATWVVVVRVNPGPRTQVSSLQVQALGEVADRAGRGQAEAVALRAGLGQGLRQAPGLPFRNADWSDSKQQVLTRLRAGGYAAASLADSAADIDTPSQTARLRIEASSGPLFLAGPVVVSGLKLHDEQVVRHLSGFDAGTPLTEQRLLDFQDRLQRAGLFQSASVTYDPDPAQAGAAELRVRVSEAPLQQATVGVGYSANTGPRTTLEHTHRRPFDLALTAYNKLAWGRDSQSWTGDFQTHPGRGFYRNLLGVQIERELSDTDVVLSQRLRLGRTQDNRRLERLYFLELLRSRKSELNAGARGSDNLVRTAAALTANYHWVRRDLDSVLLPTKGYSLALQGAAGQASSRQGPDGPVLRLYGRATGYWTLGSQWYGQARLEAGQVYKRDTVAIPDALGFRAGGDESVRGYDYRSLAPTDASGNTVSGLALLTGSLELARPVSPRLPQVWGAVFVDAGRAVDRWQDYHPALGYGVGVRWRSPVGPLRMDLAWGDDTRKLRLHLSVGIAL